MGYRSRGEIKLEILQYIYDQTKKKLQVSKRELRMNLGLGKNITNILKELVLGGFLIHEKVEQKGKEIDDTANYYRLGADGLKIIEENKELIMKFLMKLV